MLTLDIPAISTLLSGEGVLYLLLIPGMGPSLNSPRHSLHRLAGKLHIGSHFQLLLEVASLRATHQWDLALAASLFSSQLSWCVKVYTKLSMRTQTRKKLSSLSSSSPSSILKFCNSAIYNYYAGKLLPVELFPFKRILTLTPRAMVILSSTCSQPLRWLPHHSNQYQLILRGGILMAVRIHNPFCPSWTRPGHFFKVLGKGQVCVYLSCSFRGPAPNSLCITSQRTYTHPQW